MSAINCFLDLYDYLGVFFEKYLIVEIILAILIISHKAQDFFLSIG